MPTATASDRRTRPPRRGRRTRARSRSRSRSRTTASAGSPAPPSRRRTRDTSCFAEEGAYLLQQVHQVERLRQVAVGERAQLDRAGRLIVIVVGGAHQQHGDRLAAAFDLADELEAVLAG